MEIYRFLELPKSSFMLLGPRGTGKSTLIRKSIKKALSIDLLQSRHFLPLSADPSRLRVMTKDLSPGSWVVLDEIQKIPALLDEVHSLYEDRKLHFALSGSSARKLRRQGANLLAGRAVSIQLFPLTFQEYQSQYQLDDAIAWGSLPKAVIEVPSRSDYLSSYVETYLREELIEEGLIRKLEPFVRFLNASGSYHAQVLNVDNLARETHIGRSSIQSYFEVLEETLIGFRLPSLQLKFNSKEVTHPKFYLFDNGVARACANLTYEDVDNVWLGHAFEALIVNETRFYNRYLKKNRDMFYYRYNGGYEIDLIIENKRKTLSSPQEFSAIEIKSSKKWDSRWNEALLDIQNKSHGRIKKLYGVYRGREELNLHGIQILPAEIYLQNLAQGKIL